MSLVTWNYSQLHMILKCHHLDLWLFQQSLVIQPNNEHLDSALYWLGDGCARMCVMVDLNLPTFNWKQFVYPTSNLYTSFADLICCHGLTQIVHDNKSNQQSYDKWRTSEASAEGCKMAMWCLW